ncbi:MAG: phosphoribosylformylglycinamidine synthase subunit PurS [Candidatus Mycalebacterium zealandia]|nr:MAG: phosphoribosylformylglycinamidine synthase subunit PurS [Candidatus Mycalebacterium zealandia]
MKIEIRPAKGVLDPQGKTVLSALGKLGFSDVMSATVGKLIELRVGCSDEKSARELADRMCSEILANPVIEVFSVEVAEARGDG